MRDIAFKFSIANLREAGRPAEYGRTADGSEQAAQGQRERPLFFFREQVE